MQAADWRIKIASRVYLDRDEVDRIINDLEAYAEEKAKAREQEAVKREREEIAREYDQKGEEAAARGETHTFWMTAASIIRSRGAGPAPKLEKLEHIESTVGTESHVTKAINALVDAFNSMVESLRRERTG